MFSTILMHNDAAFHLGHCYCDTHQHRTWEVLINMHFVVDLITKLLINTGMRREICMPNISYVISICFSLQRALDATLWSAPNCNSKLTANFLEKAQPNLVAAL